MALSAGAVLTPAPARAAGGASCALSSSPLAFGQYVASRHSPSDFTATISLTCAVSGDSPVQVNGALVLQGSGGPSHGELTNGRHRLRYQLFLDPARTVLWGDGGGENRAESISGVVGPHSPLRQTFTVYGRILAGQSDAKVGPYADQITAIFNY